MATASPTASSTDLGPCGAPWCGQDAVVYVAGPTYGSSPRLLVIGGQRAAELARMYPLGVRCLDCTSWALDEVAVAPRGGGRGCSGCAALPGRPHGDGCDHARCPDCGEQLLMHHCESWPAGADGPDRPAIWHGIEPQAEIARTLGLWTTVVGFDHPVEDYYQVLVAEVRGKITWDPHAQRYRVAEARGDE